MIHEIVSRLSFMAMNSFKKFPEFVQQKYYIPSHMMKKGEVPFLV